MNKMKATTEELYDRLTLFDQLKVDVMALGGTIFESTQDELMESIDFIEEKALDLLEKIRMLKN